MTAPETDPTKPSARSPPAPRTATLAQVARAVFWSFLGVRKGKDMQRDTVTIKPLHVVIIGLAAGLLFVLALVALVTFITRNV